MLPGSIGSMIDPDATTPVMLTDQLRELTLVLERLGTARAELVPAASTFWAGEARAMYDRAVAHLASSLDSSIEVVVLARRATTLALAEVSHV